jgi:hypothetical protein
MNDSLKCGIRWSGLLLASVVTVTAIFTATPAAGLSAVVAYLPTAEAGQGPSYIIFDSKHDCYKYVKENSELYEKKDCQIGTPPEEPPIEG